MGTWPRTVSTPPPPPPGDEWVPGLGQYLPPGDEWVPGLGQLYSSAPEISVVIAWGVCSQN